MMENADSILFPEDTEEVAQRLKVDKSVIVFNLIRLYHHYETIRRLYGYYRWYVLEERRDLPANETVLNSKQIAVLLEFFLQMDGMLLVFFRKVFFSYIRFIILSDSQLICSI